MKKSHLIGERAMQTNDQPERGGGCAGQREGDGRGNFPNVAIDRPVGLIGNVICIDLNTPIAERYGTAMC